MSDTTVLMSVPEIEGSSLLVGYNPGDEDHQGWIPIDSCSFSVKREATAVDASGDDDEPPGVPPTNAAPMSVKRRADNTTAKFLTWLAHPEEVGRKKETVLIDFCHRSGQYFLRYELSGVEIVSCTIAYSDGELSETLSFTFDHIKIFQRPIAETGEVDLSRQQMAEYAVFKPESA
jgi:type VI protein secretion system component Hcp